jgi:hypothetical protein
MNERVEWNIEGRIGVFESIGKEDPAGAKDQ